MFMEEESQDIETRKDSLRTNMSLFVVSALIIVQSNPETPEGLINNSVYQRQYIYHRFRFKFLIYIVTAIFLFIF